MRIRIGQYLLVLLLLTPSLLFAQDNPDPARFEREIQAFRDWDAKNTPAENAILFIGSSSIRMWPTAKSFPELKVINRGFGGSHISDVLHYLPDLFPQYNPSKIVFYAGDNDVTSGKSPEQVLRDYKAFVEAVHREKPGLPIIFVSIKPSPVRMNVWPQMKAANELIEAFSEATDHLYYADVATPMLDADGNPDRSLFLDDDLHLNEKGYALWSRTLLPIIQRAE